MVMGRNGGVETTEQVVMPVRFNGIDTVMAIYQLQLVIKGIIHSISFYKWGYKYL